MGHVMQAHLHAIWGAQQGGCWAGDEWIDDPDSLLSPEDAVVAWCDLYGGHEYLDRLLETYRRYVAKHPEPPGRILGVEFEIFGVLGWRIKGDEKSWGLWALDPQSKVPDLHKPHDELVGAHGTTVVPTPLDCPGHKDHGNPVYISRRIDLAIHSRGQSWIWDHKHQARVQPGRSIDAYAIDGGFSAFRILGKQLYPDFGGLILNLIQTQDPWKVARPSVPPTPHRDNHMGALLWRAEHDLARLDQEKLNHWEWPKSMNEVSCYGRYGPCGGLDLCAFGPGAEKLR
tara:strand:+ start:5746 stop:6603 length:858 start_codon:yes stop_codon:yes gene_type:complete